MKGLLQQIFVEEKAKKLELIKPWPGGQGFINHVDGCPVALSGKSRKKEVVNRNKRGREGKV